MLSTMAISTFAGAASGAFIATLSCPFELVKVQKQLEYLLLQTSSISTGATVMHNMRDLKPTTNKTVGAGLPVTPIAIPPGVKPPIQQPNNSVSTTITSAPKTHHHSHSHPHNNAKKKNNFTSTSSWYSAREILKKKGLLGLYSGFSLHLSKFLSI
jgi:solute carrier family 25 carnitine/acylcarnitine transporter 20/29